LGGPWPLPAPSMLRHWPPPRDHSGSTTLWRKNREEKKWRGEKTLWK